MNIYISQFRSVHSAMPRRLYVCHYMVYRLTAICCGSLVTGVADDKKKKKNEIIFCTFTNGPQKCVGKQRDAKSKTKPKTKYAERDKDSTYIYRAEANVFYFGVWSKCVICIMCGDRAWTYIINRLFNRYNRYTHLSVYIFIYIYTRYITQSHLQSNHPKIIEM